MTKQQPDNLVGLGLHGYERSLECETAGGPVKHKVVEVESGSLSSLDETAEQNIGGEKRRDENVVDSLFITNNWPWNLFKLQK